MGPCRKGIQTQYRLGNRANRPHTGPTEYGIKIWGNAERLLYEPHAVPRVETIQYQGKVWAINHKYPEPLVEHALHKLEQHGVDRKDIVMTDAPSGVSEGSVVVEIWPYHLDVARVRTVRNESFISGTIMTIELKLDEEGNYTD